MLVGPQESTQTSICTSKSRFQGEKALKTLLKAVLAVAIVTAVAVSVNADPSLNLSTMVKSGYLGGNGNMFSRDPVIQSDLFVTFENGVWLDIWNSEGLTSDLDDGYDDEIDVGAGWAGAIGGGMSLNAGINYFNVYSITKLDKSDLVQLFAEVTASDLTVDLFGAKMTPYVRVETLKDMGNDSVNFESVTSIGEKIAVSVTDKVGIAAKVSLSYDPGIFGVEPGLRGAAEGQVNLKVSDKLTLTPIWAKAVNEFETHTINYVLGTGLSVAF